MIKDEQGGSRVRAGQIPGDHQIETSHVQRPWGSSSMGPGGRKREAGVSRERSADCVPECKGSWGGIHIEAEGVPMISPNESLGAESTKLL